MRKLKFGVLALAIAALIVFGTEACKHDQPPQLPSVDVGADSSDDDADDTARFPMCTLACKQLAALGCPEAKTLDGGLSCYATCAKGEASGKFTLHPTCVATARDKDTLRAQCNVRCQ